jgi:VanZ family protein
VRAPVLAWVPAATWAAFLFFLSSRESLPVDLATGLDKVAHFGAYLVLGFLLSVAVTRAGLPLALAVFLGFAYGLLDEVHQSMVPGRIADVGDWVADAAGTVAGVLAYRLTGRLRRDHSRSERGEPAESTTT